MANISLILCFQENAPANTELLE